MYLRRFRHLSYFSWAISFTPMSLSTSETTKRATGAFTEETTRAQASEKFTKDFVRSQSFRIDRHSKSIVLAMFHTYDDHEIINNFSGAGNDSTLPYPSASDAFQIYNANGNPSPPLSTKSLDHTPYYYDFHYGDVAFFVMDTRRYRSFPNDPSEEKTMLGEEQLTRLLDWLGKVCAL